MVAAQHVLDRGDINRRVFLWTLFSPRAYKQPTKQINSDSNRLHQCEQVSRDGVADYSSGLGHLTRRTYCFLWRDKTLECFEFPALSPGQLKRSAPSVFPDGTKDLQRSTRLPCWLTKLTGLLSKSSHEAYFAQLQHYLSLSGSLSAFSVLSGEFPSS